MKKLLLAALPLVLILLCASPLWASIWLVPGDAPTIQEGIDAAASGDTVLVSCGTYLENDIVMKAGIFLIGETGGPACVTIDAQNSGRVLDCLDLDQLTTIENIIFSGGLVTEGWQEALGGGVRCRSSEVVFSRCTFEGNTSRIGAGLGALESTLSLLNCTFTGNAAMHPEWAAGGGLWARDCSGTIENCFVEGNSALSENPESPGDGGGFFLNHNNLDVFACVFDGNSSGSGAGGMYSVSADSSVFSGCDFLNNSAANGGAVYFEYGSAAQLIDCSFTGNTALAGGAMVTLNESHPRLINCLFENNTATQWGGGAVDCWTSTVEITGCLFRNNNAETHGGGVSFGASSGEISNTVFVNNTALGNGGGIHGHYSTVSTMECTLVGNSATSGAGIYCGLESTATVENTIIAFSLSGESMAGLVEDFATVTCSDFFGNPAGDWVGSFASQVDINGNFSADPVFCDQGMNDFTLESSSPCALENQEGCGQVGALGVGCYVSPALLDQRLPSLISEAGNYPNPFNPATTIRFALAQEGHTQVTVFDMAGHVVRTLVDRHLPAQFHQVEWMGQNDQGRAVATGVYFYRIVSGDSQVSGRMALVK
jgi:predicted outer membrane repeat protein